MSALLHSGVSEKRRFGSQIAAFPLGSAWLRFPRNATSCANCYLRSPSQRDGSDGSARGSFNNAERIDGPTSAVVENAAADLTLTVAWPDKHHGIVVRPCRLGPTYRRGVRTARSSALVELSDDALSTGARGNYLYRCPVQQFKLVPMTRHSLIRFGPIAGMLLSSAAAAAQDPHAQHHSATKVSTMQTPQSLAAEHRELHEVLARAAKEGGELGRAAERLERALKPHFKREEEIATPPLGLLQKLSQEPATSDMRAVLPMTDALERELPQMLREHEVIRAAAVQFRAAAGQAGRDEYLRFSDELAAHARQEEEILYPAAVLVGRYVKRTAPER